MTQLVAVDRHCHTPTSFDGRVDPPRLLKLARERGVTHVAITDHDTLARATAARAQAPPGVEVIVGGDKDRSVRELRLQQGTKIWIRVEKGSNRHIAFGRIRAEFVKPVWGIPSLTDPDCHKADRGFQATRWVA